MSKIAPPLCAGIHEDSLAILVVSSMSFSCPLCCLAEHRQLIPTLIKTAETLKVEVELLQEEKANKTATLPVSDVSNKEPKVEPQVMYAPVVHRAITEEGWQRVAVKGRGKQARNVSTGGKQ